MGKCIKYKDIRWLLFCGVLFFVHPIVMAQGGGSTLIEGVVIDSVTKEKLPYVAFQIEGTSIGTMSNDEGAFRFESKSATPMLVVSSLGYTSKRIRLKIGEVNKLNIKLSSATVQIQEVVVKRKKEKYVKKQNPAVILIEKVIANKKQNQPKSQNFYQCEHYEKTVVSLNNLKPKGPKSEGKKLSFVHDFVDTSEVTGKRILAMSVKEKIEEHYYRKQPEGLWKVVLGKNSSGIDDFMDEDGTRAFLDNVFKEVDLNDNDISMLLTRFPSPLSSTIGTSFYKYYIDDTIEIDGKRCIDLSFAPFNPQSYGFIGHLYVVDDSSHAVIRAKLNIPQVSNINYVNNLYLTQDFEESPEGVYYVKKNDITVEMSLYGMKQGVQVRRIDMYSKFKFNEPRPDIYRNSDKEIFHESVDNREDEFWEANRQIPIREKEDAIDALIDRLRHVPIMGGIIRVAEILISGYIETHPDHNKSKFDIGPMNTSISYNSIEGIRLRAGGMTTANLLPNFLRRHWFLDGFGAYGCKDKIWKYRGTLTYSINKPKYYKGEFPTHALSLTYEYDTHQPGADFQFTNKDNIFVSLKARTLDYTTYDRKMQLEYKLEKRNGFSINSWFRNTKQTPSGDLKFIKENARGRAYALDNITFSELGVRLRYAPGEKFSQSKWGRYTIERDIPAFSLQHQWGFSGIMESDFHYHRTELAFQKQWWLSMCGYIQTFAVVGKVWNAVPFTALGTPNANLSLIIQPEAYNLLDAMEFMTDEWAQIQMEYHANGLLMNRLPLLKYLRLREIVGFRAYYGRLTDKNDPEKNKDLIHFPTKKDGSPLYYEMNSGPYMEMNVGVENILNVIRLDYVWRLNYRNHKGVMKQGVRFALYFRF